MTRGRGHGPGLLAGMTNWEAYVANQSVWKSKYKFKVENGPGLIYWEAGAEADMLQINVSGNIFNWKNRDLCGQCQLEDWE